MKIHAELGNTVMMITHDVDEAVLLSDRIVMMTSSRRHASASCTRWNSRDRATGSSSSRTQTTSSRARVLEFLTRKSHYVEAA